MIRKNQIWIILFLIKCFILYDKTRRDAKINASRQFLPSDERVISSAISAVGINGRAVR